MTDTSENPSSQRRTPEDTPRALAAAIDHAASVTDEMMAHAIEQAATETDEGSTLQEAVDANSKLVDQLKNAIVSLERVGGRSESDCEYASTMSRVQADLRVALSNSKKLEEMAHAAAAAAVAQTSYSFSPEEALAIAADCAARVLDDAIANEAARPETARAKSASQARTPEDTPRALAAAIDHAASVSDETMAHAIEQAATETDEGSTLQEAVDANSKLVDQLKNAIVSLERVGGRSESVCEYASTMSRVQADLSVALRNGKKLEEMAHAAAAAAVAQTSSSFSPEEALAIAADCAARVLDEVIEMEAAREEAETEEGLTLQEAVDANSKLVDHLMIHIFNLARVAVGANLEEVDCEYASTISRVQAELSVALINSKKLEEMAHAAAAAAASTAVATAEETQGIASDFAAQVIAEAIANEAARPGTARTVDSKASQERTPEDTPRAVPYAFSTTISTSTFAAAALATVIDHAASVTDEMMAYAIGQTATETEEGPALEMFGLRRELVEIRNALQEAVDANSKLVDQLKNAMVSLERVGGRSERDCEYASTMSRVQADLRVALSNSKKLEEMAHAAASAVLSAAVAAAAAEAAQGIASDFAAQVIDEAIANEAARPGTARTGDSKSASEVRTPEDTPRAVPSAFSTTTSSSSSAAAALATAIDHAASVTDEMMARAIGEVATETQEGLILQEAEDFAAQVLDDAIAFQCPPPKTARTVDNQSASQARTPEDTPRALAAAIDHAANVTDEMMAHAIEQAATETDEGSTLQEAVDANSKLVDQLKNAIVSLERVGGRSESVCEYASTMSRVQADLSVALRNGKKLEEIAHAAAAAAVAQTSYSFSPEEALAIAADCAARVLDEAIANEAARPETARAKSASQARTPEDTPRALAAAIDHAASVSDETMAHAIEQAATETDEGSTLQEAVDANSKLVDQLKNAIVSLERVGGRSESVCEYASTMSRVQADLSVALRNGKKLEEIAHAAAAAAVSARKTAVDFAARVLDEVIELEAAREAAADCAAQVLDETIANEAAQVDTARTGDSKSASVARTPEDTPRALAAAIDHAANVTDEMMAHAIEQAATETEEHHILLEEAQELAADFAAQVLDEAIAFDRVDSCEVLTQLIDHAASVTDEMMSYAMVQAVTDTLQEAVATNSKLVETAAEPAEAVMGMVVEEVAAAAAAVIEKTKEEAVAPTQAAAAIAVALVGMLVGDVVAKVVLFKECEEAENEKRAALEEERRQERERLEAVRREREEREEAERAREREEMRMVQEELEKAALVEAELRKHCKDALDFVIEVLESIENEIIAEREREETKRRAVHVQAAAAATQLAHVKLRDRDFRGAWGALEMAGDEWQKWSELRPSVYGCYALPCDRQVGQDSKVEALALLEHLIKCEETKANATIKLQRWTISCLATRKIREDFILMKVAKKNAQAAVRIQRNLRIHFAKLEYSFMKRFRMAKQSAAIRIQARQRAIVARRETNAMRIGSKHSRKVLSIQKAYRGHVARVVFTERLNEFYRQEASKVACKIQTNIRQFLARRCLKKVKRSMIMMQQWAAQFSWKRTVDYLTKVAAKDWPTICAHTAASHGRKEAFTRAQILAPAVLPSWWLSHFPFALTKRVNLKREALAELDQQIRRDRINTLGGIGDFQDALNLLSSLADDLTGKARVTALNMSDSYDLLVSLIAFCNVRGTDMVSERNFTVSTQDSSLEKCRSFGIDMLKYAERLCDGPPLGLPGLTEKLAYKQWTYSNLCRVHCMLGDYSKAAEYGRMIETTRTGDTGRDDLVSIVSQIHIALVQSKLGKHNTSISMLQKASDRLVNWCENNSQRTWTSFCNTRILSRRYICTATHVAGVCQYNLSVEYAAVEQMDKALEASKRACALASRDANSDPIFFRRCQRTLISLECISQVDLCVKRPLPLILQRLMQEESTVGTDNASESGRAQDERSRTPLSSSSVRSKVQTIKDFRESAEFLETTSDPALQVSRIKFGLWFPPHVALRLNIVDIVVAEHNDKEANSLFPASDPASDPQETTALPSIFLHACPRVSSGVENAATRNQLLSGTLMLLALPMEETECLEILHADYIALQRIVRESNIKDGFRAVLRMKNSMAHAPAKMEQIVSVQIRNRMMGLVIISIQEASKFIIQSNNIQPDTATIDYAEKYVMLAESLLFSGAFDFKHFLEMKAYARLLHSLCFCLQGKEGKALWVLSQSIVELGLGSRPKLHAVVLLNMSSLLSKMGRHEEAFESSETALRVIQGQLSGKKHDWFCFAPSHSEGELTRLSGSTFAAFGRYQQGLESLLLGFHVPGMDFCKKAAHLLNAAASPRQMLAADPVLKSSIHGLMAELEEAAIAKSVSGDKVPDLEGSGTDGSLENRERRRSILPKPKTPSKGTARQVRIRRTFQ